MSHASLPEEFWQEIETLLPRDEGSGHQGGDLLSNVVLQDCVRRRPA
jgi:hypothetical protein